jgi:hypothetical protein
MLSHAMNAKINRRDFVKSSLLVSAGLPLALRAQTTVQAQESSSPQLNTAANAPEKMPMGKIAGQEFSRLFLGGNLIGGYAHSRDLSYVSMLMRRYNTPAKIRETLELAESQGINAINTWVMQENTSLFEHWKNGGKIKWFAQARLDGDGGFSQIDQAIDQGAVGVHLTGDTAESLLGKRFGKVGQSVELIKSKKRIAGVGAHDLRVIVECEKEGLDVDFYQKTFHSHDYFSAPAAGDTAPMGAHDNSWCSDPQAVIDVMAKVTKPWIAFKILAAGAIEPETAFPHAFVNGADFILVGMFDWQVVQDAALARRVLHIVGKPGSKRTRPWYQATTVG